MYSDYFLFVILCKVLLKRPLINTTGVMLAAKEMFFKIENILREQGVLEKFKEENCEITVIWWLRCRKYFLNNEVKLTKQDLIDENIELLVVDGQLKGVVKDVKGSPNAEIVYNVNLSKANGWNDFI